MDPFEMLVTATRTALLICLAGILAWSAHEREVVHRLWRQRLREDHTSVRTLPCWMTAGTIAGFV
jgi:hypothetical protein